LKIAHPGWRRTLSSLNEIKYLGEDSVTRPNNGILRRNNGFLASPAAEIPLIWPTSTKNQRIVKHSRSPTAASALITSPEEIAPSGQASGLKAHEAALDGIYVVRTSLPAAALANSATVRNYLNRRRHALDR
jgi:hypothetical protein